MLKNMKTQKHLNPGQKGTKKLVEKYGESLVCVRYRYDETRGVMLKTVEIVVEEKLWSPRIRLKEEEIVAVAVAYTEKELRNMLKAVGGQWDGQERVWHVSLRAIRGTELESRVIKK